MNSVTATFTPDAAGSSAPKQLDYIPSLKLSDGHEIPMLGYGLGTANFKSQAKNQDGLNEKIITNTVTAIKAGYLHLDGAEAYGNESELGEAIRRSGVSRSDLFVTTKTSCRAGEDIETAFSRSLFKLQLDYVDLYLIHSPFFASSPSDLVAKWREMEALKTSGRARSIGVSNYLPEHLDPILAANPTHPPVVNQIEFHPYLQHDKGLLDWHRERGIAVEAYSPLTALTRAAPGPVDDVYARLAHKYGVSEGEVALRWCLDQGVVALTTSGNEQRLKAYLQKLPLFKLTPKEVEEIGDKGREKHFRGFWKAKFDEDDRR